MRAKNSLRNIKYNLIFYFINLFLVFFSRKVFIISLGPQLSGVHALFQNLVGFLNITELGILGAVTYSLYIPLREKNYEKINSILLTFKYLYRGVAVVIFLAGSLLSLFMNFIIRDKVNLFNIRIYFMLFLFSTVLSYCLTYLQVIIIVDQKSYIITKVMGFSKIAKTMLQIAVIYYAKWYMGWLLIEIIFSLGTFKLCNDKILSTYNWIDLKGNTKFSELIKENKKIFINTRDLFFHKLGGFVVFETDNLVISAFLSLKAVTIYSNFMLIIVNIVGITTQVFNGIAPSIGDLISEGNNEKSYEVWSELHAFFSLVGVILCFCTYELGNIFVKLWLGKEYLLGNLTLFLIVVNLYFTVIRLATDSFKSGYGIFMDRWAPMMEIALNLTFSIILVNVIGVSGVVIGTIISNVSILIWKPYILFNKGFKKSIKYYYLLQLRLTVLGVLAIFSSEVICRLLQENFSFENWISFIILSVLTLFIISLATFGFMCFDNNFRRFLSKQIKLTVNLKKYNVYKKLDL